MPVYYATIPLILQVGLRADQPLATVVGTGTLYSVSDEDYLIEQSDGATWNQWGPTPGVTPGAVTVLLASVPVTNAEIKALPTTPKTLIASPGPGFRIKVLAATFQTKFTTAAYTGMNTSFASLQIETASGSWLISPLLNDSGATLTNVSTFFANTAKTYDAPIPSFFPNAAGGWTEWTVTTATTSVDDDLVRLAMDNNGSGNLGGGNVGNSLTVNVWYVVEAVA